MHFKAEKLTISEVTAVEKKNQELLNKLNELVKSKKLPKPQGANSFRTITLLLSTCKSDIQFEDLGANTILIDASKLDKFLGPLSRFSFLFHCDKTIFVNEMSSETIQHVVGCKAAAAALICTLQQVQPFTSRQDFEDRINKQRTTKEFSSSDRKKFA